MFVGESNVLYRPGDGAPSREDESDEFTGVRCAFTVTPAGDGTLDLAVHFVQRELGVMISSIPPATFHLRDGESVLIHTSRPPQSPRR